MFWNKNGNQENNDSQSSKVEELMMRQNAKLESELEAQKQANEYLAKQVEKLKHASKNNDKQVELEAYLKDMQAEVARLQKENEEIINKAYTAEKEISVLKDSVAQKDNEIHSIKKQVAAKNAEVAVRMKELDAREKSVIDAESTYQATIEAMTEKMLSLEESQRKVEVEKKRIDGLKKLIDKRENEVAKKEEQLINTELSLQDRENTISAKEKSVESELVAKRMQVEAELNQKVADVENDIKEKQEEASKNLTALIGTKESELIQWKESEIKSLTEAYGTLRNNFDRDIAEQRKSLFEAMSTAVENERNARLDALTAEINGKRAALEEEKSKLEENKKKAFADYEKLQQMISETKSKQEDLKWQEDRLKIEKEKLQVRGEQLDAEVEEKYKVAIASYKSTIEEYQDQIAEISGQYKSLLAEVESYDNLHEMFGGNPKLVQKRISDLEYDKKVLEDELGKRPGVETQRELQDLKNKYEQVLQEKQQIANENADYKNKHQKFASLEADNLQLKDEIEDLKVKNTVLANRVQALHEEVVRLSSTEAMLIERDKRLADIRQEVLGNVANPEEGVGQPDNELEWLNEISRNCYEYGIAFPKRILYAFHTALKISDWSTITVLAGVSGTGKSELPRLYSLMGRINFCNVPVQPNWDSQESMLGYFNSIDNRFDAQPVLRFLVQCTEKLSSCLSIVLLDEMNLAHVEYYFAEFLSKLEQRRGAKQGNEPEIEVKLGAGVAPYKLPLKRCILWCGTMNQDETTKSLSDKVLDRGLVINFPRPKELKGRTEMKSLDKFLENKLNNRPMLHYKTWRNWIVINTLKDKGVPEKDQHGNVIGRKVLIKAFEKEQLEELSRLKGITERINDCLGFVGRALGHRVWQSIEFYIANYPEVIDAKNKAADGELTAELKEAMHIAFEDQIVQKIMPKLRGIDTRGKALENCLNPIKDILIQEGFKLENDFDKACQLGYGQFMWSSAEYIDDSDIAGVEKANNIADEASAIKDDSK